MRRALSIILLALGLAVVSTFSASARLESKDGNCRVIQSKPAWSFHYTERRVCP